MAKKKKAPVTPVTPQKTEDKPAQANPQEPLKKDTSCSQSSGGVSPATSKP